LRSTIERDEEVMVKAVVQVPLNTQNLNFINASRKCDERMSAHNPPDPSLSCDGHFGVKKEQCSLSLGLFLPA
jgi:hypothetical protein